MPNNPRPVKPRKWDAFIAVSRQGNGLVVLFSDWAIEEWAKDFRAAGDECEVVPVKVVEVVRAAPSASRGRA